MTDNRQTIDWEAVKRRLNKSRRALKKALSPDAKHVASIYRKRADRLARRKTGDDDANAAFPVLAFWLGRECYGIKLPDLVEVVFQARCTAIPGTPPELLGVVNLRGDIRPVLDLNVILGLDGPGNGPADYTVFLRRNGPEVGMRVDRIDEVRLIREAELTAPGEEASGLPGKFIQGVGPDTLILLDTKKLLSLPVLQAAPGAARAGI